MKISEMLCEEDDRHLAIIEVGEHEVADVEAMIVLVDGIGGDYSVDVRLVSTSSPPKVEDFAGQRLPLRNHYLCRPAEYPNRKRYYEIRMHRN